MGRIVVTEFVTLDGVMEDPGGQTGAPYGGWAFKFDRSPEGDKFKYEELMSADALLLGRVTYEGFAAAWPQMNQDEFGQKMNSIPKYVVSSTLKDPSWGNTTVLSGDPVQEITRVREEVGELLVEGSAQLVGLLAENDLVDEWRLMIFPYIAGGGKRLFDLGPQRSLQVGEVSRAGQTVTMRLTRASA